MIETNSVLLPSRSLMSRHDPQRSRDLLALVALTISSLSAWDQAYSTMARMSRSASSTNSSELSFTSVPAYLE